MLRRLNKSSWFPIILPLITFGFGIVGGRLLEVAISSLFDTSTRAILIGIFVIGLLSVFVLIVVAAFARRSEKTAEAWLRTVGIPAEIVFEQLETSKGYHYLRLIEFIHQASGDDEILIMTQHGKTAPLDEAPEPHRQLREEYLGALIEKAKVKDIAYRRIVCFDNSIDRLKFDIDCVLPWLADHFSKMLEIKKENPHKVSLKMSGKKIGADIFVIPRKAGAIVIDVYDSETGATSTNSSLFFHNPPNKQIINQLHAWFMEIDNQDGTTSIKVMPLRSGSQHRV